MDFKFKEQVKIMLEMQDNFNKQVNPEWRNANYRWSDAIMVEAVELFDHYGYKWWKKQSPNIKQCQMELIDIWHFIMSMLMVYETDEEIIEEINTVIDLTSEVEMTETDEEVRERIRTLIWDASNNELNMDTLFTFAALLKLFGINRDMLFKLYIGKNALNKFRQDHGYKSGTYIKNWIGREDNEVLYEILELSPASENGYFEFVYSRLEAAYDYVINFKAVD